MTLTFTLLLAVFSICHVNISTGTASGHSSKPNIIFILADDLGWDDISLHGSDEIPTPNIDALASDGILLNQYYVQPICTPSRAALLTGKHPVHLGLQHNTIPAAAAYGLDLKEKILPQYLNSMDYESHMVGKWHLGFYTKEHTPTHRGFKTHLGYYNGCEDYYDHSLSYNYEKLKDRGWGVDFWNDSSILKTELGQYSTEIFTRRAEELIEEHDTTKPMFLYMPHQAVHSGNPGGNNNGTRLQAPWKYISKLTHIRSDERRRLAAMISALDDSVGNVTRALHKKGMLNNTIIVFSTDNGGPANRFDYNCASNWPLRGGKRTMWEGGVRGNGFIWSPLLGKTNYVSEHFISIMDWLPTLLEATGYNIAELPKSVEGVSQWKALSNNGPSERHTLLHNIDPIAGDGALRSGHMKVVFGGSNTKKYRGWYPPEMVDASINDLHPPQEQRWDTNTAVSAPSELFQSDMKSILNEIGRKPVNSLKVQVRCGSVPADVQTNCEPWKSPCLFNITADPCEYHNLSKQKPDILKKLMSMVKSINATTKAPYPNKDDPEAYPGKHGGFWVPWKQS